MKNMRRVFIAINLPEKIKKQISSYNSKWQNLPAKWVKKDNLHITLLFLGMIEDGLLPNICEKIKRAAAQVSCFSILLNEICYFPKEKPKMIWAKGEKSEHLSDLKRLLEKEIFIHPEKQNFYPHITLCRFNQWELRKMDQEEIPIIEENIDLEFRVESVELMESVLKKGGPEYKVLQSYGLKSGKKGRF